ncbi:Protein of unknown function DUF2456 [Kalmanozyma brasiliensis GHG001]|uniref:Protein of unknown function DUF2456 n=1 Tax=Kalmanozyma brasiliensis (strain GHG001) TaxID=1365824 RepID=UPI002867DB20|nr:Protein of unknown function DUF2456 [Kalmanozyma brasiliensis GHG001]KAF6767338.1 Protein of unknown function DUF2456 [Kalmanozyma brasiliensis GHG001]
MASSQAAPERSSAAPAMQSRDSSHDVPSYPNTRIAQPRASMALERTTDTTQSTVGRSRVTLDADPSRRDDSNNDAPSTPIRPARSHRRSESGRPTVPSADTTPSHSSPSPSPPTPPNPSDQKLSKLPIDPLREPRRSIPKRAHELTLRNQHLPFGAPLPRSGIVTTTPSTLRDWLLPGPLRFPSLQFLYIVVAQSIIAACISGGINFAVAVALYRGRDTVDLWTFDRQTVAGDMGVTVIIQQVVSFIITSSLVHRDLVVGPIAPLRRPWPPLLHLPSTPSPAGHYFGSRLPADVQPEKPLYMGKAEGETRWKQYFWFFVRAVCTGSERNDLLSPGISTNQRLQRLLWTAAQGFFLCVLTFWWYWPIAIAIIAPIYGGKELAGTWVPEVIKLIYGGVMSLLTNPVMALMAMGAESSVRRCYPELEVWEEFGGREDAEEWRREMGLEGEGKSSNGEGGAEQA